MLLWAGLSHIQNDRLIFKSSNCIPMERACHGAALASVVLGGNFVKGEPPRLFFE